MIREWSGSKDYPPGKSVKRFRFRSEATIFFKSVYVEKFKNGPYKRKPQVVAQEKEKPKIGGMVIKGRQLLVDLSGVTMLEQEAMKTYGAQVLELLYYWGWIFLREDGRVQLITQWVEINEL